MGERIPLDLDLDMDPTNINWAESGPTIIFGRNHIKRSQERANDVKGSNFR